MRVAPRPAIGFVLFAAYVAVVVGVGKVADVPYADIATSAPNALLGIVLPIGAGGVMLAIATTYLGWWRPALREVSASGPRWLLVIPLLIIGGSVLSVATSDLGAVDPSLLVALFAATAVVGFAEELMARGVVLTALRGAWREVAVWLVTCALFGLLHGINALFGQGLGTTLGQMLSAMLGGTAFYVVRRVTGALAWAMVAHCLWDFGQLVTEQSGSSNGLGWSIGEFGLIAAVVAVAVLLLGDRRAGGRVPVERRDEAIDPASPPG